MATSSRWFRDAVASKKNWLSINTNPEISSPLTLQLHYFLAPCLAIKNYKKRNKNRTSTHVNIFYFEIRNLESGKICMLPYALWCTNDCGDFVAFFDGWRLDCWGGVLSSVAISSHGGEERKTERMKYRADRATTSSPGQITTQRREREGT